MAKEDPPLPSFSGTEDSLYGAFKRERPAKSGAFKRENIKIGTDGGFFRGGMFSSGGMRLQLGVALTLSIAAGSLAGAFLGGKSSVKSGLEAGSRLDAAMLEPNSASNAGVAQTDPTPEMARMLDEVRGLRAQIEQLRHGVEIARAGDHARGQETARDAGLEAQQQALDQTTAALGAKLGELDARLARLERVGVDTTPVGSIPKARARRAGKRHARKAR
ncbi:MAG: hypothetical protein WB816_01155 [Methylocystis sp.]